MIHTNSLETTWCVLLFTVSIIVLTTRHLLKAPMQSDKLHFCKMNNLISVSLVFALFYIIVTPDNIITQFSLIFVWIPTNCHTLQLQLRGLKITVNLQSNFYCGLQWLQIFICVIKVWQLLSTIIIPWTINQCDDGRPVLLFHSVRWTSVLLLLY